MSVTDSEIVAMLAVYRGHRLNRAERVSTRTWEFEVECEPDVLAEIKNDLRDRDASVYLSEFVVAMKIVYAGKAKSRRKSFSQD